MKPDIEARRLNAAMAPKSLLLVLVLTLVPRSVIGGCQDGVCAITPNGAGHVDIPATWTSVHDQAFCDCSALTSVSLPAGLLSIGEYAFAYTELTAIAFPASLEEIGTSAFRGCKISSIDLSATSVTTIENRAFLYCESLANFTFSQSLHTIGIEVFTSAPLTSLDFSVTQITSLAQLGASGLQSISFPPTLTTIASYTFSAPSLTSVDLSATSVSTIRAQTFRGATSLTSIMFPASLTSISSTAFPGAPFTSVDLSTTSISHLDTPFRGNPSLVSISLPASLQTIGASALTGTGLTSIDLSATSATSIGSHAFSDVTSLTNAILPTSLTTIGEGAFKNSGLTHVNFPENLHDMGTEAFRNTHLTNANLSSTSIFNITAYAFADCSSLTRVALPATLEGIDSGAFQGCPFLKLSIPQTVTFADDAFESFCYMGVPTLDSVCGPGTIWNEQTWQCMIECSEDPCSTAVSTEVVASPSTPTPAEPPTGLHIQALNAKIMFGQQRDCTIKLDGGKLVSSCEIIEPNSGRRLQEHNALKDKIEALTTENDALKAKIASLEASK